MSEYHQPVLLDQAVAALKLRPGGIYVDATLGGGGHTRRILDSEQVTLIAFDSDETAVNMARETLCREFKNLTVIRDNFSALWSGLSLQRIRKIDGILFDLGVSSHQIDQAERGFSFSLEGDLDMRMDNRIKISAADLINSASAEELSRIFRDFGEERYARQLARQIVQKRQEKPIVKTLDLAAIIDSIYTGNHPIKTKARIFQAIRIYINRELEALHTALEDAVRLLNPGGRMVVISYHSLEDRIVKHFFQEEEKACTCPTSFPKCICGKVSRLKIITRKPVTADELEVAANPRARSAKLRIAEKKEEK